MERQKIHISEKHGGNIIDFGKKGINQMIQDVEPGYYMFSLDDIEAAKTYDQIKFFHGPVVKAYMEYTGYTYNEAKYRLKKVYGINELKKDPVTGEQELNVRSLAKYSMKEISTFFERLLNHFEHDCDMVIDSENRKQFMINEETGELEEMNLT